MKPALAYLVMALALTAVSVPAAEAQQGKKTYRVGVVFAGAPLRTMLGQSPSNTAMKGLLNGLRELGYVEGLNLVVERRSAEGKYEELPTLVADLIRPPVDVLVVGTDIGALVAKRVTTTVPVVAVSISDPIQSGLVTNMARPGGNITGLSLFTSELSAKHLELLIEVLPTTMSRVGILRYPANPLDAPSWREAQIAARRLRLTLQSLEVQDRSELERVFSKAMKERPSALVIFWDATFFNEVSRIAALAKQHGLPAVFDNREFAAAGGLMSYGASVPDQWRRAAGYVDKILKGTKAGDLPIEQPTKFELVINLTTAKSLGLTIPQSVLLRADELIE